MSSKYVTTSNGRYDENMRCDGIIDPIHVTAMMNKKRGLAGKFARQCVNRDVTSLFRHLPYDALFKKTRLGFKF